MGDEHAHRQYERLLCRRAVERPRVLTTVSVHRGQLPPGYLAREHPEKVLGTRRDWVERNPKHRPRALVAALMEAQRWIAASPENTRETARLLVPDAAGSIPRSNTSPAGCLESMTTAPWPPLAGCPSDALLGRGRGGVSRGCLDGMAVPSPSSAAGVAGKQARITSRWRRRALTASMFGRLPPGRR